MMRGRLSRVSISVAVAALALSTVAGCSEDSGNKSGGSGDDIKIAWVVGNTQDAFYQKATEGAKAKAKELGIELIDQGPNAFDPAVQIPVVDGLLAQKPDAIAIAPVDAKALTAPLLKYHNQDIPIVVFDTLPGDNPEYKPVAVIGSKNHEGGAMAAAEMAKRIGGQGKVAIIDFNTSDKNLTNRAEGFKDELKKNHPGIEVVDTQYTALDFPKAQTIAQTYVNKYPDLKGIFCTYSFATEFAAKGVLDLGIAGKVTLIGFEAGPKQIEGLTNGSIQAVVAQQPYKQGEEAIQAAYDAVKKKDVKKQQDLDSVLITKENMESMKDYFYEVK